VSQMWITFELAIQLGCLLEPGYDTRDTRDVHDCIKN